MSICLWQALQVWGVDEFFFFYERRLPVVTSESQFQSGDILSNLLLLGGEGVPYCPSLEFTS